MRAHAIVIGIDQYEKSEWCLSGAVRDAVKFAQWALKDGGVAPGDLTLLLSPLTADPPADDAALAPLAKPATRSAIAKVLWDCQSGAGKNVDRLWFYYAGHGLAPPGSATDAGPLVVPADVTDLDFYVNFEPLGLETFRSAMQNVLPQQQFFFIDACRDVLPLTGNKILTQQLLWDVRGIDDDSLSTQAVFLSTTAGQRAKEIRGEGLFGRALIAALRGLGPELLPPPSPGALPRHRLLFDQLVKFVRDAVKRGLDELPQADAAARKGIPYARVSRLTGDITVAEFDAASLPKAKIGAIVEPAPARSVARIDFLRWDEDDNQWVLRTTNPAPALPPLPEVAMFEIRGGSHYMHVEATGYETYDREILVYEEDKRFPIKLKKADATEPPAICGGSERLGPGANLESFGDVSFEIEVPQTTTGAIDVSCPDRLARLAVYDGGGNEKALGYSSIHVDTLTPGPYKVTAALTSADRVERTITVRAGETERVPIDVAAPPVSQAVEKVLAEINIRAGGGYAHPSENFGPVANMRLASVLAYAAWASRWPEEAGFHHLRALGVDPLPGLSPEGSALQVLLADATAEGGPMKRYHVRTQQGEVELVPLPKVPNAVQGSAILPSRPARVRVEMPGFAAASFAVALLPKFVTVLVVSLEEDGDMEVQQHLNPIDMTRSVSPIFGLPLPDDVRLVEIASRALEHRDALDSDEFEGLLTAKRSNPMLGVIAGYRMFGTTRAEDFVEPKPWGGSALWNMVDSFDGLPDVHVLAGLYDPERKDEHFERAMQRGTPVIAEGFWTLLQWMTVQAMEKNAPPPALSESVLPIAWTAFSEPSRAARADALRIVTAAGQTRFGDSTRDDVLATSARAVGLLSIRGRHVKSSAFLIAPRLIVCPLYMARALGDERDDGRWTLKEEAHVEFDIREPKRAHVIGRVLRTLRPAGTDKVAGGALERDVLDDCWPVVVELTEEAMARPLLITPEPPDIGQPVAVIGFPHDNVHYGSGAFAQHFAGSSGEKHVMWGSVVRAPEQSWTFDYDCFTTAGTGGGPVINVENGAVFGMHVAGLLPQEDGRRRGVALAFKHLI